MDNSQWEIVLDHLEQHGSITSLEAIDLYGFTRLSGIIYILKKHGYNIKSAPKRVTTRWGKETTVALYTLIKDEGEQTA